MRLIMRRVLVGVLLSALVGVGLAGCAEDAEDRREAYCDVVSEKQKPLSELLAAGGPTALLKALPHFEDLKAKAPSDVKDEWGIVVQRISALEAALEDAGVDPGTYDPQNPPETLTDQQQAAISGAATALAAPETAEALNGVLQHARDICQTPLTVG